MPTHPKPKCMTITCLGGPNWLSCGNRVAHMLQDRCGHANQRHVCSRCDVCIDAGVAAISCHTTSAADVIAHAALQFSCKQMAFPNMLCNKLHGAQDAKHGTSRCPSSLVSAWWQCSLAQAALDAGCGQVDVGGVRPSPCCIVDKCRVLHFIYCTCD